MHYSIYNTYSNVTCSPPFIPPLLSAMRLPQSQDACDAIEAHAMLFIELDVLTAMVFISYKMCKFNITELWYGRSE